MLDPEIRLVRRSLLKGAAASGAGLVAGGIFPSQSMADSALPSGALAESNEAWFNRRAWSVSGNKLLAADVGNGPPAVTSLAKAIYRPRSAEEIASLVRALPAATAIACVCGGHESSNAALVADGEAVILDLGLLTSIDFSRAGDDTLVTVGSGVVFRELVEAVREQGGALPVGTGPGVGVVGYLLNGGLSSYFSRRLGLLGQRVVKMTVVTAAGELRVLTPDDESFTAMLGAGSALAIVVDVTLRLAEASAIKGAEQRVFGFESREQAVNYSRNAISFMRGSVIPNESVSLEIVITGTKAIVVTTVFYDSFEGSRGDFVRPLEDLADSMKLPRLAEARWGSWYEAAAALWPVIAGQKGTPLATLYHCVGTEGIPTAEVVDFVCDTVVGEAPLDEAELSIVEIRSLGGAAIEGPPIPSGNCRHAFFVDLVTLYDAAGKTRSERQAIVDRTNQIVDRARTVAGLGVDFSGTHSQPDDIDRTARAAEIFGTPALAAAVRAAKQQLDPGNRLRFHPFAKFLT